MWTVIVAGIDVIHPARDGFPQDRNCFGNVPRRTPHHFVTVSSRKLHGAETHAVHRHCRAREGKGALDFQLFRHVFSLESWLFFDLIYLFRHPRGVIEAEHLRHARISNSAFSLDWPQKHEAVPGVSHWRLVAGERHRSSLRRKKGLEPRDALKAHP